VWSKAEKSLRTDKYIGALVAKHGPCEMVPRERKYYFEDLVDAIIQQQLSIKAAGSIFGRVKKEVLKKKGSGSKNKHKWRKRNTVNLHMTPDKVLVVSEKRLRNCGLSESKVEYIKGLSRDIVDDRLDLIKLDELKDSKVREILTSVRGIGDWTADMFLMFSLARPDVFPVGDLGLRRAFKEVVGKDMQEREMVEFAKRWRPYRTVASWYLWASIENN
jgi:DNA-3-methyladenine glycosylase II